MENKITIFYKKRNLEMDAICENVQDLSFYSDMDLEDAEMVYGCLVVDGDKFIIKNRTGFYLEKDENGNVSLKVKEDFQETLKKYLDLSVVATATDSTDTTITQ